MKKIIHLTVFLAVVAGLAGAALSFANNMTAPIIEENNLKAEKENLAVVFPNAKEFEIVNIKSGADKSIKTIYKTETDDYVYKVSVVGFKDNIIFMLGIQNDGTIKDFVVLQNNDTSGIGTQVNNENFKAKFVGQKIGSNVDTISGATVSSSAVVRGIDAVAQYHSANVK